MWIIVTGHYSSNDANSQTGAYYCVAKAVSDGTCDCGWRTQVMFSSEIQIFRFYDSRFDN